MPRPQTPSIVCSKAAAITACVGAGGCKKRSAAPAADPGAERGAPLPAADIQRGQEACTAYVAQACAATLPAVAEECKLAKALPEAVRVSTEIAASEQSTKLDSAHALDMLRKTTANCISQTAALARQGVPATGPE